MCRDQKKKKTNVLTFISPHKCAWRRRKLRVQTDDNVQTSEPKIAIWFDDWQCPDRYAFPFVTRISLHTIVTTTLGCTRNGYRECLPIHTKVREAKRLWSAIDNQKEHDLFPGTSSIAASSAKPDIPFVIRSSVSLFHFDSTSEFTLDDQY